MYEPHIRARLGTTAHFCKVVVCQVVVQNGRFQKLIRHKGVEYQTDILDTAGQDEYTPALLSAIVY